MRLFLMLMLTGAAAAGAPDEWRPVALTGCVQATGDPSVFLLSVPGSVAKLVRGFAQGQPIPENAGVGPAPRTDPATNPPVAPPKESGRPEGRYSTPEFVNRTYKLDGLDPTRLKPLVGQAIRVSGELPVAGFPSGDAAGNIAAPRDEHASGAMSTVRAKSFKALNESCLELMQRIR